MCIVAYDVLLLWLKLMRVHYITVFHTWLYSLSCGLVTYVFPLVKYHYFIDKPYFDNGVKQPKPKVDTQGPYKDVAPWVGDLRRACHGVGRPYPNNHGVMWQDLWTYSTLMIEFIL